MFRRWFGKQDKQGGLCDPDHEYLVAQQALAMGDSLHAAHHIAQALSFDPLRSEWLAVLDGLIAGAGSDPCAWRHLLVLERIRRTRPWRSTPIFR
jgi:hypothetical protein